MSIGLKNRILVAVGLLAVMTISFQAQASHFRFGHATWVRVSGNTVNVTITEAWRATAVTPLGWNRGDGSGSWQIPAGNVIATGTDIAGENWTLIQETFTHTYPNEGPFTVSAASCCRIGSIINTGAERLEMVVDLRNGNGGSPASSVPIIVPMAVNAVNNFALPIADPDGDSFTVRMSTSSESSIPFIAAQTNTLGVSSSGLLTWDTAGTSIGQKYAVQVMIEEDSSDSRVPLDFIIEIVTVVKAIPTCVSDGPINTIVNIGTPVSITFTGTDSEGDDLTVTDQGLPAGATLTPASGTTGGSPLAATFDWTPSPADAGTVFAGTIIFTESVFGLAGSCGFTITVPLSVAVPVDIKPGSCPNPLNCRGRGVIPVAILGSSDLDILDIDPVSIRLVGVAPIRSALEDVGTPFLPLTGRVDARDCTTQGPDGFLDLSLKFDKREILAAIEAELGQPVEDGDVLTLMLEGVLNDGQLILGEDVVIIRCGGKDDDEEEPTVSSSPAESSSPSPSTSSSPAPQQRRWTLK